MNTSRALTSLALAFTLGLAGTTITAADGRVPISSAPYTITSPGTYYLTQDINYTGTSYAIAINSDHVTLDLNGRALGGNGAPSAMINSIGHNQIRITNGNVYGGFEVIRIQNAVGVKIDHLSVNGQVGASGSIVSVNGTGGAPAVYAGGVIIEENVITLSNGTGNGSGIYLATVNGARVSNNVITNSTSGGTVNGGMYIGNSLGVTVAGNTIYKPSYGIYLSGCANSTVSHNTVSSSTNRGLTLDQYSTTGSNNNIITGNSISGGGSNAIYITNSNNNVYSYNITRGNATNGTTIASGTGNTDGGGNF